jgi:TRAP-type transport system periplasmic protein
LVIVTHNRVIRLTAFSFKGGVKMRGYLYLILVVFLIAIIALSGCAGQAPQTAAPTTSAAQPAASSASAQAAGKTIELRFATFIPPTDVYAVQLSNWAKELEQKTNGQVKITFFPGQALLKVPEMLDGVASGTADMAFMFAGAYPDRLPLSQIMSLPTMIFQTSSQSSQTWWALNNKYKEHQDEYTKAGVKALWFQMPGPNQIEGNVKVEALKDLNGVKIAVDVREEMDAFKLLGAVPVIVAGGDKFVSLQTNVVNASTQNFNGSNSWKTHQVTKYITENVDISYRNCPTIINLKTYNNLPPDVKKIFDEVSNGAAVSKRAGDAYDESNAKFRKEIEAYHISAGHPPIFRLPDAEKAKWRTAVAPIIDGWASQVEGKGLPGKAMLKDLETLAQQYK